MKKIRILTILTLVILGSFLLSACTGGSVISTWPGLSASQNTIYLADAGKVYAINAQNGAVVCSFPEKADNTKPFYAAPAVSDSLIVAGSYGHMLYGLGTDCSQKWSFDSGDGHFAGTPLVVKDTVIAPTSNNKIFAVSASTGKEIWNYKTKNSVWASPVSDGTVVYQAALDHNLYALNLADGKLVWKKDLGSALLSAPLLTKDGILYVSTMEGDVAAVKAADGSVAWTTNTGGRLWGTPALQGDVLYVGNVNGQAVALSAKDGKIAWQKDLKSPVFAGAALIQDGVVFPTEDGTVIALSLDGQKELWRQTISGKLYSTPAVAGQVLAVGVYQGDKLAQAYNVNGTASWPFVAPK